MRTSQESERAIVGAILSGDAKATDSGLTVAMFIDPFCAQVFSLCAQLEKQGKVADLVTVTDIKDDLDVGKLIELARCASVERSLVPQHIDNVRTAAARRELTQICMSAASMAADKTIPLEETTALMRGALDALTAGASTAGYLTGTDATLQLWEHLEGKKPRKLLSTGLPRLDRFLNGGIWGGKLAVIGARPSVGKSALAIFVTAQALLKGSGVMLCSLEMSEVECMQRLYTLIAGVDSAHMETQSLTDDDWTRMTEAMAAIPSEKLRFTTNARTPSAIRREALKMRAACGLDLIVIDYLQLMSPDGKTSNRAEAVGEISRSLKLLALELGVPILCGAQVNRQSTQGEERAPKLSELRESGSIEQDADIVFLMHAPSLDSPNRQLIVAKNRQGKTGTLDVMFDGSRMRFLEVTN